MTSLSVELPDKMTTELDQLVATGWFADKGEIVRLALLEFIRKHQFALIEQFQREDIAWALQQANHEKQEQAT